MEAYKWLYNFLLITLYYLIIDTLFAQSIDREDPDLLTNLKVLEREMYGRLDPPI